MKKLIGALAAISIIAECALSAVPVFAAGAEVQADADALTVEDILSVPVDGSGYLIDNLDLDRITEGEINKSPISWSSSNESIISSQGIVKRGETTADVTVTAAIGSGEDAVTKDFTFKVPAKGISVNGMPMAGEVIYEDTFSDGVIDANHIEILKHADSDILSEHDGKFEINRTEWIKDGTEPGIAIKASSGGQNTVYEYTLDLTDGSHYVRNAFIPTDWKGYPLYFTWQGEENPIYLLDNKGMSDLVKSGKMKVTAYFDFANKQFSVWLNNELAFENTAFLGGSTVDFFKIFTVTAGNIDGRGRILVDNVKVYRAEKSNIFKDLEGIDADMGGDIVSVADGTKYITDNLSFAKTAGANGSEITYTTDDTAAVDENGVVTRDIVDRPVTVTVTAKDASGNEYVKNFKYVVPGEYHLISSGDFVMGDKLPAGEIEKKDAAYITSWSENGDGVSFASDGAGWKNEPGFMYTHKTPLTGKFIQRISFKSISIGLRFRLFDSNDNTIATIYQGSSKLLIESGGTTIEYSSTKDQKTDIKLLFDFDEDIPTITPYINGTKAGNPFNITTGAANLSKITGAHLCATIGGLGYVWGVGTTEVSSLAAYKTADAVSYPEIMKSDAVFGNAAPAAGENTAAVSIAKTTEGELSANVIYAIYAADGTLKGVSLEPVTLSPDSHREYTLSVTLDAVTGGETQKVFLWDSAEMPVKTEPFPVQ